MFGKRTSFGGNTPGVAEAPRLQPAPQRFDRTEPATKSAVEVSANKAREDVVDVRSPEAIARDKEYHQTKSAIFNALIDSIDLSQLATMDQVAAREEIRDIVAEIIALKSIIMSISEQEDLLEDICNDVLGYGPLEPLLARDDISDIMVNGSQNCYIEVGGRVKKTNVRFRDDNHLMNVCQRIVSQVGRRVDESSPICDARLPDGSRVNVIAPPLAIDGAALTIRKFKKDKLTLQQLVKYNSISPEGAEVLRILGRVRANILISGGTGSGKTTLLNCLTAFIEKDERVITCEDSAELQLQQPHVVRLETRPPNLEGEGEITMRDLVKNCLRMRPERIIVGEVRGPEAFDLLQAMNTGHDGSMGTLHANSPREAMAPPRVDDHHGRLFAAEPYHPRDDHLVHRRHRPGGAPARRIAPHHPHFRSAGHGRRGHRDPGHLPLRHHRRGPERHADRSPPVHRHHQAEFCRAGPLFQRRTQPGRGAGEIQRRAKRAAELVRSSLCRR